MSRCELIRSLHSPHPLPPLVHGSATGFLKLKTWAASFFPSLSLYLCINACFIIHTWMILNVKILIIMERQNGNRNLWGRHGNKASVLCNSYKVLFLCTYPLPTPFLPLCHNISPGLHHFSCPWQLLTFPLHPACSSAKHTLHFLYYDGPITPSITAFSWFPTHNIKIVKARTMHTLL